MERKNNKKRLAILILLLVALVGVTGYGVYSYYYTQGSFNTQEASDESSENVIRITGEFNPIVDGTGDSGSGNEFLGRGGSVDLECPDSSGGHERIKCTANISVRNEGTTPITVEVEDGSATATSDSGIHVYANSPIFDWEYNTKTIAAGQTEELNVEVYVNVGSESTIEGDQAVLVTGPVNEGTLKASVSFRLKATQNNN